MVAPLWTLGCAVAVSPVAAAVGWASGSKVAGIATLVVGTLVLAQIVGSRRAKRGKSMW